MTLRLKAPRCGRKPPRGACSSRNGTLRDLIGDEVRDVFSAVLTPLWTEAWHLGYAAAKSLVTGEPADFAAKDDSEHLRGFIGSEEQHWLGQISRTGLGNNSARSETIARTEVARAINSAAIQCYRDHGVSHKHLLAVAWRLRHLRGRGRGRGHPPRCALLRGRRPGPGPSRCAASPRPPG